MNARKFCKEGDGKMRRVIHIYGASGSGTSTLGRSVAERLGYTFMDTDDYYWLPSDPPYTLKRDVAQRLALMERDIDRFGTVVLSGSLAGWGDPLIPYFTLAVRVVTDTNIRLKRLREREAKRYGERISRGGDMHAAHVAFLEWAAAYDEGPLSMRSRARHDDWQTRLTCHKLTVNGACELDDLVELVLQEVSGK